jgi:thiosulfate/3-mercaptopyruvate sulfurtransferase
MRNAVTMPTRQVLWTLLCVAFSACSGSGDADTALPLDYGPDVLVDAEWVEANMANPDIRLLEVGANSEGYDEGHLPGAAFLAMRRMSNPDDPIGGQVATGAQLSEALSSVGVERDQTVVLYDRQNNLSAARAYWVMKYYQHAEVRVYNGGTRNWSGEGRALSAEVVEVQPSSYEAGAADPAIRTTWEYVIERAGDPSTLLCDARSPDEHLGRDVRSARGGHIPGSINVEWTAAVDADGTFKSAEELVTLYGRAGFTADKEIITYCQSGMRGAHTWFVLSELLSFPNVRNYDGSWNEYGNKAESPIEG